MNIKTNIFLCSLLSFALAGCSSEQKLSSPESSRPQWTQDSTRTVDNGYIVYIGHDSGPSSEKAKLKAEGTALEDLANECSLIPIGTRIEDRFTEATKSGYDAYVKIAVEFRLCNDAQHANTPESIRKIANSSFTKQLKDYQDYLATGEFNHDNDSEIDITDQLPTPPPQQDRSDVAHYYAIKQYVVYQKEVVVLSPTTAFHEQAPETKALNQNLTASSNQIQNYQTANPQIAKNPTPWSRLPDKPKVARPSAIKIRVPKAESLKVPSRQDHENKKTTSTTGTKGKGKIHKKKKQNFPGT